MIFTLHYYYNQLFEWIMYVSTPPYTSFHPLPPSVVLRKKAAYVRGLEYKAGVFLHALHQSLMLTRNTHKAATRHLKEIAPHGEDAINFAVLEHGASTGTMCDASGS